MAASRDNIKDKANVERLSLQQTLNLCCLVVAFACSTANNVIVFGYSGSAIRSTNGSAMLTTSAAAGKSL